MQYGIFMSCLRQMEFRMYTRKMVIVMALLVMGAMTWMPSFLSSTYMDGDLESLGPKPTEHWLSEDAEKKNKIHKRNYIESMHRTPPGVDWVSVEKQNGLNAMERKKERIMAIKSGEAMTQAAKSMNAPSWRELGSNNLAGRIHCAAWSSDEQDLYAGSDKGGLWKGKRDGTDWTPLGDNLYGGVHEVGIVPSGPGQPDILIVLFGDSIHRSTDQGLTWAKPEGLSAVGTAKRILVLDDADSTIFVLFKNNVGQTKLYRSIDNGASFALSRNFTYFGDIWTPRTELGPVYASDGLVIYESTDKGLTWHIFSTVIPASKAGKSILAGSENPSLGFNVAISINGTYQLWRSTDAGQTWAFKRDLDDFWESLVASSQFGDVLAYGGVEVFFTWNGGIYWPKVNPWGAYYGNPQHKLHADIPGLFVFPDPDTPQGEVWYIGTDGGLYESYDKLDNVNNLSMSGLGVSQYYSVYTSRRNPDLVLAGSQDQGYQRADLEWPAPPPPGPWGDFDQLISGDYGHLTSSDGSHDLVYCVYPGFVLIQEGEDNPILHTVDFPTNESYLWMPPVVADPNDKESFFFCAKKLYRYTRQTGTNNWSYVLHSDQSFTPGYMSALAFSPVDPQRAWAVTSNGKLFYSNDGGVNWTQSANTGPGSHYFYGTELLPSSTDVDTCWVGGSGYGPAPVRRTTDGGVTWVEERDGLPNTLVYCMAAATDTSGAVFCGTESGAWRYDPDLGTWHDILGTEAPINTYWTCESVPSQNLIRFGTYGRGIWDYSLNTAGYFPYGELLGEPHVLELSNMAAPHIGQSTTFSISGCVPGASGALALSLGSADFPYMGGKLLVQYPFMLFPFVADGNGIADVTFNIPANQNIVNMDIFYQAGAEDVSQVNGFALSQGLRAVIGD